MHGMHLQNLLLVLGKNLYYIIFSIIIFNFLDIFVDKFLLILKEKKIMKNYFANIMIYPKDNLLSKVFYNNFNVDK